MTHITAVNKRKKENKKQNKTKRGQKVERPGAGSVGIGGRKLRDRKRRKKRRRKRRRETIDFSSSRESEQEWDV